MRGPLHLTFLLCALALAMPAGANVYKCIINGETRYQDEPCPGDKDATPHLEFKPDPTVAPVATNDETDAPRPAGDDSTKGAHPDTMLETRRVNRDREPPSLPAAPVEEGPLDRVAQLGADIAAAEAELRAVVDERRDVLGALDVRLAASGNDPKLRAERNQRESGFRERRIEVSDRLRRLRAELDSACPNGTFLNGTRQACR